MLIRTTILGMSVAGLLAATCVPASAQIADFFCSTFSISCEPPPPPPPPAPVEAPPPAPVKHKHKAKPKPKKTSAEAAPTEEKPK